jgi:iron complex outermembrane receptor protein
MSTNKFNSLFTKVVLLLVFQFFCFAGFSQITLKGRVLNQEGDPLPGAAVVIKGSIHGVSANADGVYQFENLKPGSYELIASFLAFESQTQEIDLKSDLTMDFVLEYSAILADEVLVSATRAGNKTPVAMTNISKDMLRKQNTGQDIPYQLSLTPSLVESSESGSGVGYSALRIRGTDATRINVTINGVPLNDSESQGVYWVNMPDFASSVDNIQIQRGVGTSTNGSAAFGASINFQTETVNRDAYAEVQSLAGSFNTFRNTFKVGTGLIDGKFSFDARYSKLKSDGFVDRAFSDHESFFMTGSYYTEKSLLKLNIMSGDQKTGISWWGNPTPDVDRKYNPAGEYTDAAGKKHYYKNQTDNYKQTHYQLFYSLELNSALNMNAALHYTKGKGFYEQFKDDELYSDYELSNSDYTETDLTRQKSMKNDFYGATYSLNYNKDGINATIGGAWNRYDGDHFGEILWAENGGIANNYQWYFNNGEKTDYNTFAKVNIDLSSQLSAYVDVQYRHITYKMNGLDDNMDEETGKLLKLNQEHKFDFINPKAGLFYIIDDKNKTYASFGLAHREPTRSNFKEANGDPLSKPKQERLFDYEFGYTHASAKATLGFNLYYMYYRDQLVSTGNKSSVGYDIMTNVDKSYRAGIEFIWGVQLAKNLKWDANLTLSRNRIKDFVEYSTYYDEEWNKSIKGKELGDTHISYSPEVTGSSIISWTPVKGMGFNFISKYVGDQYFDNTSSKDRKINEYCTHNFRLDYSFAALGLKNIGFQLQVNNLLNKEYNSNAYGGNWYEQGTENTWTYVYPQAGTNFMAGVSLRF